METNSPESTKYAELSRWCIGEADNDLRRRNNIQASEKGWGAAAQALKSVAEERGWNHHSRGSVVDIDQHSPMSRTAPTSLLCSAWPKHCTLTSTKTGCRRTRLESTWPM